MEKICHCISVQKAISFLSKSLALRAILYPFNIKRDV